MIKKKSAARRSTQGTAFLWDNFLVDWMMQDRINSARAQLDEVITRVEQILTRLHHESAV